jgi:hypothetical protein
VGWREQVAVGRFQAHYRIDYKRPVAPQNFRTRREAESFLAATRTDLQRGTWVNPDAGKTILRDYAAQWRSQRNHRPRTQEFYEILLRRHILPTLGELALS